MMFPLGFFELAAKVLPDFGLPCAGFTLAVTRRRHYRHDDSFRVNESNTEALFIFNATAIIGLMGA